MNHRVFAGCVFCLAINQQFHSSKLAWADWQNIGKGYWLIRLLIRTQIWMRSTHDQVEVFEKRFRLIGVGCSMKYDTHSKYLILSAVINFEFKLKQHKLLFSARQHQQPRYYQLKVYTHFLVQRLSLSFIETRNLRYKIAIYSRSRKLFKTFMLREVVAWRDYRCLTLAALNCNRSTWIMIKHNLWFSLATSQNNYFNQHIFESFMNSEHFYLKTLLKCQQDICWLNLEPQQ